MRANPVDRSRPILFRKYVFILRDVEKERSGVTVDSRHRIRCDKNWIICRRIVTDVIIHLSILTTI